MVLAAQGDRRIEFPLGRVLALLVALTLSGPAHAAEPSSDDADFFEKHIRPVLVERCYQCHSSKAESLKGGLLLDSRDGVLNGGEDGAVVVPGKPDQSKLIEAIHYTNKDLQMPPKQRLTDEQVGLFEEWIRRGAPDPRVGKPPAVLPPAYDFDKERQFWSFQPVKDVQPPDIHPADGRSGVFSAVDAFLEVDYSAHHLRPAALADKRALIRRATYDLIGLPPTPEEVAAFVGDESPNAFEKLVDRLLASPHYGEKWGRHWLDIVRYADTSGCNSDFPIVQAYKYRNYVIDSFNCDKPYDQFLREQLAGDLLRARDDAHHREQTIATGYLAISRRFGSGGGEFHLTIADTIDNVGKAMLGLSLGCARCHDHKFDPVPTSDYYALYGIFASTKYSFPGTELLRHPKDLVPMGTPEENVRFSEFEHKMAVLDKKIHELSDEKLALSAQKKSARQTPEQAAATDEKLNKAQKELEAALAEQRQLDAQGAPAVELAYGAAEGKPHDVTIQQKGSPTDPGPKVARGFLTILGGQKLPAEQAGSGRLELAQWITDPHNPLTARVMVNRIWEYHFGKGLVTTPNDFGHRGAAPTNPALLDYLAGQFIRDGWSIKAMHKRLMLSRAYQMSDSDDAVNSAADPANAYFWRFEPRRLSAEEIRDSILADAGTLDLTVDAGPHPFPPVRDWHFTQHKQFMADYPTNHRSIYLLQERIRKQPFLGMFDGADTNDTSPNRPLSTTALQALFMMNDPFMYEQADRLASRVSGARPDQPGQIDLAFQLLFAHPAAPDDVATGQQYLAALTARLQQAGVPDPPHAAIASYLRVLLSSNEFIWLD